MDYKEEIKKIIPSLKKYCPVSYKKLLKLNGDEYDNLAKNLIKQIENKNTNTKENTITETTQTSKEILDNPNTVLICKTSWGKEIKIVNDNSPRVGQAGYISKREALQLKGVNLAGRKAIVCIKELFPCKILEIKKEENIES